jgi:hypothetical protein
MINNFDISEIEDSVIGIIKGLGMSRVYSSRPKSAEPSNDFVVVSTVNGVSDLSAYGECTIRIDLFAKDVNQVKNGKRLSYMYQKLREGFPSSYGRLLFDTEWNTLGDTPDDFGYHARLIRINTTIKAI